jgi:hypothetical protein
VAAKKLVNIQTANAHIDWAAAKKITLTTSGGAQIVIGSEGVTVQCPGQITVRAAQKSFAGGAHDSFSFPEMPASNGPSFVPEKEIIELFWTYGDSFERLSTMSRHYVDMNLHVRTRNYRQGESVSVTIDLPSQDGSTTRSVTLTGAVNKKGEAVFVKALSEHTFDLGWRA